MKESTREIFAGTGIVLVMLTTFILLIDWIPQSETYRLILPFSTLLMFVGMICGVLAFRSSSKPAKWVAVISITLATIQLPSLIYGCVRTWIK